MQSEFQHRKALKYLVGRKQYLSAYELKLLANVRMTDATLGRRLREDKQDGLVQVRYVGSKGVAVYKATQKAAKRLKQLEKGRKK